MAKDTFDKLRSILAEREGSPYSQDRNKYQEITAQYDNDLYNSPEYKLRQDINNAKSDMWGTSGIGGLVERFSDNFFSTLGNTITGLDLSDTTNQFGKEMTRNATLRIANLPDTVEAPHDKGMGAWLNYFTDINRGAIPQVANVGGSALAMLIPTALTMIPAGRVAGIAMKAGKNLPAVGRAVTALENSENARQLLKDLGMGAISGQYEALAEKGAAIDKLEQMGLPHDEAVKQANAVHKENSALLTATNAVQSALANPILRGIIPGFNVVDDIANGVRQVGRMSANAQALRRFANMVPKPITTTGKVAGSIAGNMALNGYEEGVQNQIQSAHTPTIDEDGNFVWKDYQSINDLMNPYQWSDESIRAAEEGAVGAGGLALLGHGAGGVRSKLFNRPNTDVDTIDPQLSDNGIPLYNDQHYIITDTVSNPNATEDTLARLNALAHDYEEQFGEKLMVTSLRRDGNGDSWHDSGQAIDIAGGGLETNQNGEREWLLKRGEELGLTGLDEYAHPSDHATGGHIHFSNHNDGVVADNEFEDEFDGEEDTASDFDTFADKIGLNESGNNYDAVNSDSGARGKYQIMPENWGAWAEEAGLDANAEMTPENQEIVARHKLKQYYDKYGEKGALVAWYAGEGNAERYVKGETTDVWGREWTAPQDGAPSIQSYVDETLAQNVPNGGRKRKTRKTQNTNINSTGNEIQSDNATLDDYLKLFDDGNKNSMTYADYERLINSASDDEVLANANKAVMDYTQEGNLDSFTQLTEMIGDDDVDGLRELAKEHARAITIDEQSPNDNEIDNTADVQNEPINTFDFTEAINGLMEIANNGIQEQQVVARQALQSNAPLFVLNTYKQLTSGAPLEQHISEQNNDTVLPQTKLQQQPINDSRGIIEPTPQEQQQVNENAQQEAKQQAESLNNNAPLTAQEQATANSVLNSADGAFTPQIKNELFNALRNGDNAGVRRVINGVLDNIPSQADVNQQSMAEIQESIGNARKNVNRAMAEKNLAGFMETLDEVEKEFMEFLDNLFYETGKGFIDVANGLISDVRRSRSEEEREVLINAIEGLATIAGKAKEYEARRNELRRESGVGKAESNRPVRQTEIPSEAREIAKAYGLQLKERLKQNNVPISEQAIDRSLNSENQNEVEHVVSRLESIAERNNVPVEDIKENKPKTINQQLAEARAEKEELLGGYLKYIDETSGQGVDIIPLNDGSSRGVRSTKNAKWYSEWYQQNKQKHGKMSKKDKLDIAEQMYRGQIETEETAVVNRLSKEEFDKYQAEQKEAIEKLDAINAKIAQLEKAKEETKNNNDKEKIPPKKGASSNAKKKKEPKTTLTQQESREGVESETQGETPSNKNKPVLNRKSEGQNSKAEMVKESGETATVSKAEIVGENIRDDFKLSRKINDAVRTSLITIDQLVLSGHSQKDIERYVKNTLNLVDTLSDFTADEKQVMKEVLQSRSKKAIDKAVKILERNGEPVNNADEHGVKLRAVKNTDSQIEKVRKQYEGTDQWMKAPNGKPTNLTERQWLQVRTPNFKKWFGDWENDPKNASKVVDENGEPLVVYHGTPLGGFEVFNRELNYFTADKEYADRYQDPGASSDYVKGVHEELGKAMTYPVFLNIRKPFDTRKAKERKIFEKEFYRQWGNGAPLSEKGLPDWTDSDDFREFFEENDYDYDGLLLDEGGVPTEDGNVKSRGISYVAFKPNQIKSATDNSGEFNTENDNIKYSRAVSNPNSAESLKKNGDTDTRLDKLPKVDYTKLNKTEKDIMKFGKALGIPVHFVTHYDPNYRGVFTHNGEIFINRKATVPAKDIFIHEFVHWLKASGNENIYDSLSACLENINGVSHAKRLSEYRKYVYNGERMTNDEIIEEIICDAISYTATANKMFNAMNDINPTMAERTLGYFKTVWDKFCNAVGYKQNKPVGQQKLPNFLNANELAKVNAVINQQLANLKDADGKAVFVFKDGKWTTAKSGKELSTEFNSKPVSDTVPKKKTNTDVANNIQKQPSKPTEETASSDTEGMFKRANKELLKKMGFKVDADKNVDVVRKSTNPQDINVLKRMFMSPSVLGRHNKLVAPLVSMAKSAVEKQEKLRYEFRESLNDVEKILGYKTFKNDPNYKENKESLNSLMILGDAKGKEYNAADLKKMGYNEQVIKAYLKMRKTLNDAWEMLNNITKRMKFGTSNLTEGELVDLKKKNPFLEITSVSSEEDKNGRKRYTYKYPSVTTITEHLSKEDIDNLKKNEDVKIISSIQINNNEYIVKYAQRRRMGKIKGYVPHMFHEWSVVEVDKDGKILQDDNGNSKFIRTFSSMNEAIKYANGLDKDSNYRVMPKLHEVMGASERSMIVQDYNYLKIMGKVVEDFTLTPEEAVELMNSGIKTGNRGRFLGNLMKRKGVKGYEEDMMYATYQYLNQVGRYVALDPFKRLAYSYYEKMFGAWEDNRVYDGELGQTAKWARMYIDSVNGVPTSVEKNINNALHALGLGRDVAGGRPAIWLAHAMTYPMTISLLGGGNVSSALLNITQLCNLFGAMGDMSVKSWKKLFKNSYKNYWIAWRNPESEMGKLLWKDLGLRYMLGMDVAGGYSRTETDGRNYAKASALAKYSGGLADLQARVGKIAGASMFMFRGTDSFGRGVTLLTAYQKAIDEGKTKTEAIRYAKMICDRVNFDYSQADANGLYQRFGVLANVFLQFQKYPMKQLELFYDIFKEQKGNYRSKGDSVVMSNAKAFGKLIQYMLPYMALTGISGVPFIGLASALLGFASGDDDKDLVEEIRAGLRKEFGEDSAVVNAFNYGLLGAAGVDVGKRIGIGDYLSGGTMKQTTAEMLASKSWVAASTAMQSARQLSYGNYAEALKAINPSLGNIWIAANGEVRTTRGRLKYQYQSNWERFVRCMGFTPVGETLAGEQAREDYKNRQDEQAEKQAAIDEFIAHPTPANAKTLNDLGITPKSLKTERERKNKTSHEINQEKEKKKKEKEKKIQKKKVYSVNDYQKEK